MRTHYLATTLLALAATAALAQQEGPTPTQALVFLDGKGASGSKPVEAPAQSAIKLEVNNRVTPLTSWTPVQPGSAQVAILLDDGLGSSVGRQLEDLRSFVTKLPAGIQVFIGYMQNGRVVRAQEFTSDHAAAAEKFRLPEGIPGTSASPYFCLSDFVKHWPAAASADLEGTSTLHAARFVLMVTNGVDPYNGSVSITNQNSPYVAAAIADAQRAGVAVYSIYYGGAGMRGGAASFSGQSYLAEVAQGTGGTSYYEGTGNPVSLSPFLDQFKYAIAETYVATFQANAAHSNLVRLKVSSEVPRLKFRAPEMVRPGNLESPQGPLQSQ